ncbi:MAG TPA: hypothetical protein VIA62_11075 [Thermoanaerobaculia bacterium]|jgi:hypothetical protein|nr:hypothetical protein [Thermoanaerobaculia bacterium]
MSRDLQDSVLTGLGAAPEEAAELRAYNQNVFELGGLSPQTRFPLPDEPFVAFWAAVVEESRTRGAFAVLRQRLPQLAFPIREGISRTETYRDATLRGVPVESIPAATGLELEHPEAVEVVLHPSPAGRIPLLVVRRRPEFETLVQALTRKNEPEPVAAAQGALMVAGYNNWSRIRELRRRWEALEPSARETATWGEEFQRLQPRKELYQDRFILLSDGPYSAVPAGDLGLGEAEWRELSLVIRRDHECAHYLTRRLFGSMRNNLLDELMADYAGLVGAVGRFRADWFLRFLGLEDFPRYRAGARLDLYRGKPPLSDGAYRVLQRLIREAALSLERFDARRAPAETALTLAALAYLRLEDLAAPGAEERIQEAVERLQL